MKRWKRWIILSVLLCLRVRAQASGGVSLDGGSVVVTGPAGVDTTGNIELSSGTLQAIGAARFSVGGNWSQAGSGNFACDQSTVFFLGDATVSGTNRFYNLTAPTVGQTLTLPSGLTQTVANAFTMSGSAVTLSRLRSSAAGSFAYLLNLGPNAVQHVDARDCDSFGGQVIANTGPHSTLVNTVNWSYGGTLVAPRPVTSLLSTPAGGAPADPITYSWTPASTYADGSSIQNGIGTTYEVTRYADLANSLNGTLSSDGFVETSYGPTASAASGAAHFGIRAVVNNVKSDPFDVDNSLVPNFLYASSNGFGYVSVPPSLQGPFTGLSLPYLYLSLAARVDPPASGVLATVSLAVQSQGGTAPSDYQFVSPGATMVLKRTGGIPLAQASYPVELSVNGAWKPVGAAAYSAATDEFTFTVYQTGHYRVTGGATLGGETALSVLQSVHPRIFTPNGDGYNDIVHFDLYNPNQDRVSGQIFDVQAAKVADLQTSAVGLEWDGKAPSGRVVPGGVYIYQIQVGNQRANGTVVVVK